MFKNTKELNIRSVFEEKYIVMISPLTLTKAGKLKQWAHNAADLATYKMNEKTFADIYMRLYKKLNSSAQPYFDEVHGLVLLEDEFEPEDLKLLAFLWHSLPLDSEKFTVQKADGNQIKSPNAYIQSIKN